ncbi:ube2z, partial [Symbiodinium sp. CCMP2592]
MARCSRSLEGASGAGACVPPLHPLERKNNSRAGGLRGFGAAAAAGRFFQKRPARLTRVLSHWQQQTAAEQVRRQSKKEELNHLGRGRGYIGTAAALRCWLCDALEPAQAVTVQLRAPALCSRGSLPGALRLASSGRQVLLLDAHVLPLGVQMVSIPAGGSHC